MNKQELVAEVASGAEISRVQANKAVGAVLNGIVGALKKGEDVRLVGFGTFEITERKATKGRNPRTGEEIDIPASRRPRFKSGKALRDAVLEFSAKTAVGGKTQPKAGKIVKKAELSKSRRR